MVAMQSYPQGVYAVDALYQRPRMAAVHLVVEQGRVAVVDTGTRHSLAAVLAALAALGLGPTEVDWVLLTHVHLDHAGGAGALMALCPAARLVVHPRGLGHMQDPTRLWAGAAAVYGEPEVQRLYGDPVPVAAERMVAATEGLVVELAGRPLVILDTPGHARHHVCIWDAASRGFFTGDTFGLSYRELDVAGRPFIFPTTTPVQFDPEALHASVQRMLRYQPEAMYLTHFGRVVEVARLAEDFHRLLAAHVAVALAAPAGAQRHGVILAGLKKLLAEEGRRQGWVLPAAQAEAILAMDLELNAQGLGVWLDKGGG